MDSPQACPRCGTLRLATTPAGLCPGCLLQTGLASEVRSPGILSRLDETLGPPPRMLLRDATLNWSGPALISTERMPSAVGDSGRYQLQGEIARGGMGVVLRGRDVDLGRDVAIKVILEKHCTHSEMVRRFVEEAQIAGQLQHPGIIPVYELGRLADDRLYIAMKLIRGRTLAALLEERSDPNENQARYLSVFEQVCQAMAYAHACGVIHRDLKPSNIMVGTFGEVQVMDWGLAKVIAQGGVADEERSQRVVSEVDLVRTARSGSSIDESRAGSVLGTPSYMSPEQALGRLDTLDERADVFGLGAILCEILTGVPPYSAPSGDEVYRQAARGDLSQTLSRLDGCGADAELVQLAKSCLATAARDRPRNAGVVAVSLTDYLAKVQERLKLAELARARADSRAAEERKRRLLVAGLAAALLTLAALVGGGSVWLSRQRAAREAATSKDARSALHEASLLLSKARAAPPGELIPWVEVSQAARRSEALLRQPELSPELRRDIQDLAAMVAREHEQAEARSKHHLMLEKLAAIHSDIDLDLDYERADREHAAAFRSYGIDIDRLTPEEAGARVAASPIADELVDSLDQWTFVRQVLKGADAGRLAEVAKAADPDAWRCRLRDALSKQHGADRTANRQTLEDLAASVPAEALSRECVSRLAFALDHLGEKQQAVELLRSAQQAHPEDFWINYDLARSLMGLGQPEEAARFYTAAVAIRPQSERTQKHLRAALQAAGGSE